MARPNPLAGRTGEGAPIAPTGWLWKAGNRPSDMYFYSPVGQKFRSQLQLQSYLEAMPNPPPMSSFRWRIGPEEFEDGLLPGVPPEDPEPSAGKKRSKGTEVSVANKRRKMAIKKKSLQFKSKKKKSKHIQISSDQPIDIPKTPAMQTNGFLVKDGQKPEHGEGKVHKKKIDRRGKKETGNLTFRHLLSAPTSANQLSKNAEILHKFLDEAARLKEKGEQEKGEQEIDELRNVLIYKKHNAAQLSKYPESVLQVFFFLLRNQEPPANIGKEKLIEFCSKWSCKHKHFWCLLETQRLEASEPSCLYTKKSGQMKHFKSFAAKENDGQMLDKPDAQGRSLGNLAGNGAHHSQHGLEESNCSFPYQTINNIHEDTTGLACQHGNQGIDSSPIETAEPSSEYAVSSDQFVYSKDVIEATNTENDIRVLQGEINTSAMEVGNQFLQCRNGEGIEMDEKDLILTAEDLAVNPEDACLSKETIQKELEDLIATPHSGRESAQTVSELGQLEQYEGYKPRLEKCGCQVCSRDSFFCYGCTCILCKAYIQHKQSWTFIKCPICNHFCHLECALKARRAGVVKELEIDGEFICPCCLNKSDLVPFWTKRVNDALTSIDRPMVQKCLTSAVFVLNGTQRQDFQTVHQSVTELHDSLLYNSPCPHLRQILQQIQEKVDVFNTPLDHNEHDTTHLNVQDDEVLQEEEKVREGQKQADLDYVEWLMAEKNADMQRSFLRAAQEQIKKDELDISSKASHARASRAVAQQGEIRLQALKRISIAKALIKEQIENQRLALDMELTELNKVQNKLGFFSSEPHEDSTMIYSSLLEEFKVQSKRVENVKARLEYMDCVISFFS